MVPPPKRRDSVPTTRDQRRAPPIRRPRRPARARGWYGAGRGSPAARHTCGSREWRGRCSSARPVRARSPGATAATGIQAPLPQPWPTHPPEPEQIDHLFEQAKFTSRPKRRISEVEYKLLWLSRKGTRGSKSRRSWHTQLIWRGKGNRKAKLRARWV